MIYIKSTLVGLAVLFVATIAYIICAAYFALRNLKPPPNTQVAFMVGSIFNNPSYWLIAVAAFTLGFYWEFHRIGP
jgi:hypothetical protein